MSHAVKVHSCYARTELRDIRHLRFGWLYYSDDPKFKLFKTLPKKCSCKLVVDSEIADIFVEQGKAFPLYRPQKGKLLVQDDDNQIDCTQIVMPVNRAKTPRVDLITSADIERAYVDGQQKYIRLIDAIHEMIMTERMKLIVPFQRDPFEGRVLFPFPADQRTKGGHF